MTLAVISPHLDDGILSVGQTISGYPDPYVVTVMAGNKPRLAPITEYDMKSGLGCGCDPIVRRRLEDSAACEAIGARPVWLDLLDQQYREGITEAVPLIEYRIGLALADLGDVDMLFVPLGLTHPDHIAVSSAALRVARGLRLAAWVYEELPYRVNDPDEAAAKVKEIRMTTQAEMALEFLGSPPLAAKEAAVSCYVSQLWAINVHACLVPERLWRISW